MCVVKTTGEIEEKRVGERERNRDNDGGRKISVLEQ